MNNYQLGNIRVLSILVGTEFVPVGCVVSQSFSEQSDLLGTTTRDNAGWRTSIPTFQRYSIDVECVQIIDANLLSFRELLDLKRNQELISWKIESPWQGGTDSGKAYVQNITETSNNSDALSFSFTLLGVGELAETLGNVTWDSTIITWDSTLITWDTQ